MTTATEKKKKAETRFIDATGAEVRQREKALAAPQAAATTANFTLHNGAVTFEMEVQYNPNSYPHVVSGGKITSGICGAPWNITGGVFGDNLRLDAQRAGTGSCASTITILGDLQQPAAYRGTYGFDGATSWFKHTTIYHC